VSKNQRGAAGPWIKIEPGCEMPEPYLNVLFSNKQIGWWSPEDEKWMTYGVGSAWPIEAHPTYYAIINQPEDQS